MNPGSGKKTLPGLEIRTSRPAASIDRSPRAPSAAIAWENAARWPSRDRPVLVAPDSFKGTLSAPRRSPRRSARGLERAGLPRRPRPGRRRRRGHDGRAARPRSAASWSTRARERSARARGRRRASRCSATARTALVEVAAASGLALVAPAERDAEAASSAGTGELIAAAVGGRRARTCSSPPAAARRPTAGVGAIEAIEAAGGLRGARITVLCDVRTPFEQAAAVFAPQKGADAAAVARLERAPRGVRRCPRGVPMTGAAGGLAGGLWARARRRAGRRRAVRARRARLRPRGCARAAP